MARHQRQQQPPAVNDREIMGIAHPLMTEAMIDKLVAAVPIPLPLLKRAGYLLSHPAEFEQASFAEIKAIVGQFNVALDAEVRLAQERNLKANGKARP
jgi:hypothetical protein